MLPFLAILATGAHAATLSVGPTGTYASLAEAVDAAISGDTLSLEAGEHAGCVDLGGKSLTLQGAAGSAATIVDAGGLCEDALYAGAGEALVISGLTVRNAGGRGLRIEGGASLVAADLVVDGSGASDLNGGGLYVDGGSVALTGSRLSGNTGALGGNLYATGGASLTITDSAVELGVATSGGGIYAATDGAGVSVALDGASVSQNQASSAGAGIFLDKQSVLQSAGSSFDANVGVSTHGVAIYTRADVTLVSVDDTFTDNAASDRASGYCGGAIYLGARGSLDLSGGLFSGNAAYEGGAIFQQTGGALTLYDVVFQENSSYEDGGAVHLVDDATLSLDAVDFLDNEAEYGTGGALVMHDVGELDATDVRFEGNTSAEDAGAVYLDYAVNASFLRTAFTDNTARDGDGGALRHGFYGALLVQSSSFEGNTARDLGGAVALDYLAAESVFQDTTFTDNTSELGDGGAIYAEDYGDLSLTDVNVSGSVARYDGGGVYVALWGDLSVDGVTMSDNTAELGHGGGLYVAPATSSAFDATITGSSFLGNAAGRHGGGVYSYGTKTIALDEVTLNYNAADGDGPGVYHGGGLYLYLSKTVSVTRSMFCANTAANGGGVFVGQVSSGAENTWTNNRFVENTASGLGGGAYFGNSKVQSFAYNAVLGNLASSGGGVYARGSSGTYADNIFAWTQGGGGLYGGDSATAAAVSLSYSDWYTNTSADVGGTFSLTLGSGGNIGEDPGFTSYTMDGDCDNDQLWLSESSALVDAGSTSALDPDGSTSDIGPYGGPDALAPDADGDGHGLDDWGGDDCDDADAGVYPGAAELCDDQDQDCDGAVDEDAVDARSWYVDEDGDAHGAGGLQTGCDLPASWADLGDDCDDADASVYPGASEVNADGLDQDCDGLDRLGAADLAYGDLLVSELMADPTKVEDAVGEWFEIANLTESQVDLHGLVVSDDDTDTYTVPATLLVAPGETALFAVRAESSRNGGLPTPDHVWTRSLFRFDNARDEIILSYGSLVFDRVAWGTGRELTVHAGAALSLDPERMDPDLDDLGYAWCSPTVSYGLGDLGSPDAENESCGVLPLSPEDLTAGELFVTEIMVNPSKVDDALGEWFEIANVSGLPVDLAGLVLADEGTDHLTLTSSLVVESGGLAVLAVKSSAAVNGGNTAVDLAYARATFRFDDGADEILLKNAAGTVLDRVAWTTSWGVPSGAALALDAGAWDATSNDSAESWCAPGLSYGLGDLGSPGSENEVCALDEDGDGASVDEDCDDADASVYPGAAEVEGDGLDQDCDGYDQLGLDMLVEGDLVLSEVMVNPKMVDDSVGEWFEVYNATELTVDLGGLVLSDLGTDTTTVSGAVQVLPGEYALFAVKSSAAINGGLPTVDYVWTRTPFRFDNGPDEIVLSYGGLTFDSLSYGPAIGLLASDGASISVDPSALDATLNDDPGAWCAGSASYGLGDLGTPGVENSVCP